MRGLWLLCSILLAASPVLAQPGCKEECRSLQEEGMLDSAVGLDECTRTVCVEDARVHYTAGRYSDALASLDEVQDLAGEYEAYRFERGLVLYALGRLEEALAAFDLVVEAHITSMRSGSQRGHVLMRLGRFDEAMLQFQALSGSPQSQGEFAGINSRSYLLGNVGIIQLHQGNLQEGRETLSNALQLDGDNQAAGTYLYRVLPSLERGDLGGPGLMLLLSGSEKRSLGQPSGAAADFAQLTEGWPKFGLGWRMLAEIQIARGEYAECEAGLRRGEAGLPDDPEIRVQRIRCQLLSIGPTSEGAASVISELEQVALDYPENSRARELLMALDRPVPIPGPATSPPSAP